MSAIQEFNDYVIIGGVRISKKRPDFDDKIEFERRVAAIFRSLGAEVEHDTSLAGTKVDILVSESSKTGTTIRSAVECKASSNPVTVEAINAFSGVALFLRQRGLIDKAVIVSLSGFTEQARSVAVEQAVAPVELADLVRMQSSAPRFEQALHDVERAEQAAKEAPQAPPKRAFVVMPFAPRFNQIFLDGIRAVTESLDMIAERGDEIEHNENILDVIQRTILGCDVVIAEISSQNANVMYEVGFAHGRNKPTILICENEKSTPSNLIGINRVEYSNIDELRKRLEQRLRALI